jgi:Fe-S cluster biogenesis protein NfuA
MSDVSITAEPSDHGRCRFVVDRLLWEAGVRRFGSAEEAQGSALAEAIFAIPGVTGVMVAGNTVSVEKDTPEAWQVTGRQVGAAIRSALASGRPLLLPDAGGRQGADDALFERVAEVFDRRINPMVAGHGGFVDLIDVQDQVVLLRMGGGCQGCGMASVTLRQGIEAVLKETVPDVKGIVDITDHASGANPYFAASKK